MENIMCKNYKNFNIPGINGPTQFKPELSKGQL